MNREGKCRQVDPDISVKCVPEFVKFQETGSVKKFDCVDYRLVVIFSQKVKGYPCAFCQKSAPPTKEGPS